MAPEDICLNSNNLMISSFIIFLQGYTPLNTRHFLIICWIVMRIWVKVDFLKVFMVTLVISALNFFVTIPNILVFNLNKSTVNRKYT